MAISHTEHFIILQKIQLFYRLYLWQSPENTLLNAILIIILITGYTYFSAQNWLIVQVKKLNLLKQHDWVKGTNILPVMTFAL